MKEPTPEHLAMLNDKARQIVTDLAEDLEVEGPHDRDHLADLMFTGTAIISGCMLLAIHRRNYGTAINQLAQQVRENLNEMQANLAPYMPPEPKAN